MLKKCWLSYFLKLLSMAYKRAEERLYVCSCQHLKVLLFFGLVKNITSATSGTTVMNSPLTSADLQREAINLATVIPHIQNKCFYVSRAIPEYAGTCKAFESNLTGTCFIIWRKKQQHN